MWRDKTFQVLHRAGDAEAEAFAKQIGQALASNRIKVTLGDYVPRASLVEAEMGVVFRFSLVTPNRAAQEFKTALGHDATWAPWEQEPTIFVGRRGIGVSEP